MRRLILGRLRGGIGVTGNLKMFTTVGVIWPWGVIRESRLGSGNIFPLAV
jgi:hypothetical protein